MRVLRWVLRGLVVVLSVVAIIVATVYVRTDWLMKRRLPQPPRAELTLPEDSARIAEGGRLATRSGCRDCHRTDLGGGVVLDEPVVMRLVAPNLTMGEGGRLASHDNASFAAAVRHGIAPDGRPLLFMPSHEFNGMADDQLSVIMAWALSQPPVERDLGATQVGPGGRLLYVLGQLSLFPYDLIDHTKVSPPAAPTGVTLEHGKYLARGCEGCHGHGMSGGKIAGAPPEWPPAGNLTPTGIGSWSEADFVRAMKTGIRPDGRPIRPPMPLKALAAMTDQELVALRRYLATLAPRPSGSR